MSHDTHTHDLPNPPPSGAARLPFWRRGPRAAAEPPPPIWELPELDPPGLWTRLKQRADRWLGEPANPINQRQRDGQRDGQEPRAPRTGARREDTAQVRPPAASRDNRPPAASRDNRPPAPSAEYSASPPISAAVFESAYEAVRQGRISDPATIRAIADRFAGISPDAAMSDDLGFDPREAVRALRQRAVEIARARGLDADESDEEKDLSHDSSPARGGGHERRAPRQAEARIERDENITRGG